MVKFDLLSSYVMFFLRNPLLVQSTMRVWDVLFNEGVNILFRVALAFFMIKEEDLLRSTHVGEAIKVLQEVGHNTYDPEEFLKVAFEQVGSISTQTITKQRKKEQPAVQAELERQFHRLQSIKEAAFLSSRK